MVREISLGDRFRMSFVPSSSSRVADFDKTVADRSTVTLSDVVDVPDRAMKPLWADIVPTDKKTDGSYRVLNARIEAGRTTLHLDTDSFVVGPKDKSVFGRRELAEAFRYAFIEGAQVVIPFSYHGKPRALSAAPSPAER